MPARKPTAREYAAVIFALAVARGALSSLEQLQLGNVEPEELSDEVRRILKGTSAATIAKALGLRENDVALDWTEVLTEAEMHLIRGGDA